MMGAEAVRELLARAEDPLAAERPWYVGLLIGAAGWLAGLLILLFVGAVLRPDTGPGALASGAALLAAAWGLYKADREGAFVAQLALALSVAGQFALLFGLHESLFSSGAGSIATIALVALAIQLALVPAMPNGLHRTLSTLFACIAWAMFVRYGLWDQPFWAGRRDAPGVPQSLAMALAGWIVTWAPAGLALGLIVRREAAWMAAGRAMIARPVATGLIAGLAFATLLSHPFETFSLFGAREARSIGWLALWPLLSALAALGALAAAFALGSRALMGLCVLAALLHLAHFYYAMGTSLIAKSLLMLAMGAACLASARSLRKASA